MRGRKNKWAKGEMSRTIVVLCIRIMIWVLAWAAIVKTLGAIFGWMVDLSDVLTFAGGFFGGELVLLAFKRIFAKDRSDEQ